MTDNRTTELLQELRDLAADVNPSEIIDHVSITRMGWTLDARWLDLWHAEFDRITGKLEQAIAAKMGSGTLTAEQVREAIERHFGKVAVLDDGKPVEWRDDWFCKVGIDYRSIADELNAALGDGECRITASSTDGLTSDEPKQWFELSCGHAFKLYGLDAPVACPVCGKAVKR